MKQIYLIFILAIVACEPAEDGDHAHDAEGNHIGENTGVLGISQTIWTEQTELFVEFPALVVGQTTRFAAHFTQLDGHKPILEGAVTVSLVKGTNGIRHKVDAPNSPGIFTPALQPKEAGNYALIFDLETTGYKDRIVIAQVEVFASLEEASNSIPQETEGGGINFLKEQAWKIAFQTEPVQVGEVYDVIHTSGIWEEAPNTHKSLVATTAGVVDFGELNLTEGMEVKKGQLIATITSEGLTVNNQATDLANAQSAYEQVRSAYERKRQLYASKIVAKAELEEVQRRYEIARSNLEALKNGFTRSGKQIIAPFDGFIKSVQLTNGSYVAEGTALMTLATHQRKLLVVQVSPSYSELLGAIQNIWYQPSRDHWSSTLETGGDILSVGKGVNRDQPMLPVYAQINEDIDQPDGSYTEVQIGVGEVRQSLVIPARSLLEDYGTYSVMVQLAGETFERREVALGRRNGQWVEVHHGLSRGEVIVTEGAFQVKMTSMSGQTPSHGHAH
jgi:RND family efflux transporter MFP subunit